MQESLVWMNVTTSENWQRPPVGIVRVEQMLSVELSKAFGPDRFRLCVFLDGQFVEWSSSSQLDDTCTDLEDLVFPKTSSFDLARRFLKRAAVVYGLGSESGVIEREARPMHPRFGDVLISLGLDWDYPFHKTFSHLRINHGVKIITCCYDLIPVLFPQYCVGDVAGRFKEYFNDISWGSDAVLCISEQTKNDYLNFCEKIGAPVQRVQVIALGDNVLSEEGEGEGEVASELHRLAQGPYILFVSTIERRKNHEVLYRAYHILARRGLAASLPKLVFVGMPGWGVADLLKDIELDPEVEGLIVQFSHVKDAELSFLYRNALFCVYPSLYEGWGLPVGEALSLGKAVLASSQGSIPEVGGELVKYVDPWNSTAWADEIWELVSEPAKLKSMERRVSSLYVSRRWSTAAQGVKALINELCTNDSRPIEISPGYELSTQVGVHFGGSIISNSVAGFLLFGPHRHLAAGEYRVRVYGEVRRFSSRSSLYFEFVSSQGGDVHNGVYFVENAQPVVEGVVVEFDVVLKKHVEDYEIRCIVNEFTTASISKIRIFRLDRSL